MEQCRLFPEGPLRGKYLDDKVSRFECCRKPFGDIGCDSDLVAGPMIGTRAKFADGAMYDGFVRDYKGSYPMPIAKSGGAFWVKMN